LVYHANIFTFKSNLLSGGDQIYVSPRLANIGFKPIKAQLGGKHYLSSQPASYTKFVFGRSTQNF